MTPDDAPHDLIGLNERVCVRAGPCACPECGPMLWDWDIAMMAHDIEQASRAWPFVAPLVFVPQTEEDLAPLVRILDTLIDLIGENEYHPLVSLMDVIGTLVEKYEGEHVPELTT